MKRMWSRIGLIALINASIAGGQISLPESGTSLYQHTLSFRDTDNQYDYDFTFISTSGKKITTFAEMQEAMRNNVQTIYLSRMSIDSPPPEEYFPIGIQAGDIIFYIDGSTIKQLNISILESFITNIYDVVTKL